MVCVSSRSIRFADTFFLLIGTLGLVVFAPIAVDAAQSAPAGHHSCEFTDYGWPISPEAAAQVGGHGRVEYDADARGTITDGWMTIHAADDTHALGQNRCDFELVSGTYEMKSATSGTTTIKWKLRAGSDAHCGAYIRDCENLGFVQSARDFSPITYTSNFFSTPTVAQISNLRRRPGLKSERAMQPSDSSSNQDDTVDRDARFTNLFQLRARVEVFLGSPSLRD